MSSTLSIDPDSGLIAKQTFIARGPGGQLIEERFSDYRTIDGVQVPFTTRAFGGGRQLGERQVTSISFNKPIDPALFKRPSS